MIAFLRSSYGCPGKATSAGQRKTAYYRCSDKETASRIYAFARTIFFGIATFGVETVVPEVQPGWARANSALLATIQDGRKSQGKDIDNLDAEDLAPVDHCHGGGMDPTWRLPSTTWRQVVP